MGVTKKRNTWKLVFIIVLFIDVPIVATTNIDCGRKSFHCVNSTHFLICVELSDGVSTTIDSVEIPCPPATVCQRTNNIECEVPKVLPEVLVTTSESSVVQVFPSTTVIEPGAAKLIDPTAQNTGILTTTELSFINESGMDHNNDTKFEKEKNTNSLFAPYTEMSTFNRNISDVVFEITTEYLNVGSINDHQNNTDNLSAGFQLDVNGNIIDFTTISPINDFIYESNHNISSENKNPEVFTINDDYTDNKQFEKTTEYLNLRSIGTIGNDTDDLSAGLQLDVNGNVIDFTILKPIKDFVNESNQSVVTENIIYNNTESNHLDKKKYNYHNPNSFNATTVNSVIDNESLYTQTTTMVINRLNEPEDSNNSINHNPNNNDNTTNDQLNDIHTFASDNQYNMTVTYGTNENVLKSVNDIPVNYSSAGVESESNHTGIPNINTLNAFDTNTVLNTVNSSRIITVLERPMSAEDNFIKSTNVSLIYLNISAINAVTEPELNNYSLGPQKEINVTDVQLKALPSNEASLGIFTLESDGNDLNITTSSNSFLNKSTENSYTTENVVLGGSMESATSPKTQSDFGSYLNGTVINRLNKPEDSNNSINHNPNNNDNTTNDQLNDIHTFASDNQYNTTVIYGTNENVLKSVNDISVNYSSAGVESESNHTGIPNINTLNAFDTNTVLNTVNSSRIITVLERPMSAEDSFIKSTNVSLIYLNISAINAVTEPELNNDSRTIQYNKIIDNYSLGPQKEINVTDVQLKTLPSNEASFGIFTLESDGNDLDITTSSNSFLNKSKENSYTTENVVLGVTMESATSSKTQSDFGSYLNGTVLVDTDTRKIYEDTIKSSTSLNDINNISKNNTIKEYELNNTSTHNIISATSVYTNDLNEPLTEKNTYNTEKTTNSPDMDGASVIVTEEMPVINDLPSTEKIENMENENKRIVNDSNIGEFQTNRNIILSNVDERMTDTATLNTVSTNYNSTYLVVTDNLTTTAGEYPVGFEIATSQPDVNVSTDYSGLSTDISTSTNESNSSNKTANQEQLSNENLISTTNIANDTYIDPGNSIIDHNLANTTKGEIFTNELLISFTNKLHINVTDETRKNIPETILTDNYDHISADNTTEYDTKNNSLQIGKGVKHKYTISKAKSQNNTIAENLKKNFQDPVIVDTTHSLLEFEVTTTTLNIADVSTVSSNLNINETDITPNNNGMEHEHTLLVANDLNVGEQIQFPLYASKRKLESDIEHSRSRFNTTTITKTEPLKAVVHDINENITSNHQLKQVTQINEEKTSQNIYFTTSNYNLGEVTTVYPNLVEEQIMINRYMLEFSLNKSHERDMPEVQSIPTNLLVKNKTSIENINRTSDETYVPINKIMGITTRTKNTFTDPIFVKTTPNHTSNDNQTNIRIHNTPINLERFFLPVLDTAAISQPTNRSNIATPTHKLNSLLGVNLMTVQINSTVSPNNTTHKYNHEKLLTNSLKICGNTSSETASTSSTVVPKVIERSDIVYSIPKTSNSTIAETNITALPNIIKIDPGNNVTSKVINITTSKGNTYNHSYSRIIHSNIFRNNGINYTHNMTTLNIFQNMYNGSGIKIKSNYNNSVQNINTTALTSFNCTSKIRGRYVDRRDCRKFYICVGRIQPIIGTCPINTVFSDITKQCTKNVTQCNTVSEFNCTDTGRFIDNFNENIYFICVRRKNGFVRFKFQCQNGYQLNKTDVKCVEKRKAKESSVQSSMYTDSVSLSEDIQLQTSIKDNVSTENFRCEEAGIFADENDCRKYYVCTKNNKSEYRRRRKHCESDEVFHKSKKKCVDEESYEC